jgi:hypothetical protein
LDEKEDTFLTTLKDKTKIFGITVKEEFVERIQNYMKLDKILFEKSVNNLKKNDCISEKVILFIGQI